jgi:hypothetical protein
VVVDEEETVESESLELAVRKYGGLGWTHLTPTRRLSEFSVRRNTNSRSSTTSIPPQY